jgi:hypothetical protein
MILEVRPFRTGFPGGKTDPGLRGCQEIVRRAKDWLQRGGACFETRPFWALLSLRYSFDGTKKTPHPEEAAKRPSRRTYNADPNIRRFPDSLLRRDDIIGSDPCDDGSAHAV